MGDKKELILRLPEDVFQIIKNFKKLTGISYNSFIYNAVFWYMITKGLLSLDIVKPKDKTPANPLPESLKYCDGDKCEI